MKIAGRIIQNKYIAFNTEEHFAAKYKQHTIWIQFNKSKGNGGNPYYDCNVWSDKGKAIIETTIQRCTIRDALIFALDRALL